MAPHADFDVQAAAVTDTSTVIVPDPVLTKNPTRLPDPEELISRFTLQDVLPHRQQCAPMPSGVAPFSSAEMFKSASNLKKPKARRWDHRLTLESRSRQPSSLKGAMKYFHKDIISLCGGLPSSDYFPFESLSIKVPVVPNFSEEETAETGQTLTAGKHDVRAQKSLYDLSIALNYGQSMGPPQLNRFVTEHTEIVHNPPYADWDVCLTVGSTSSLDMSLRMFCSRGDFLLMEEYSFSSAIETARPMGLHPVGIKMDDEGLLPSHLDEILSEWDEEARGGKKPFVLYTVPTGQNPTSATQSLERRKAIYSVAEKHDLIILEDEPYYFLQMEDYVEGKVHDVEKPFQPTPSATYLANLIPSYLSLDKSGRVVRMDSFSKIINPGSRAGWITASSQLVERFVRHQEVSSQTPSGFATMSLFKLLDEAWGHEGFLNWLGFIRAEYTRRRDIICNACLDYLPTQVATWTAPKGGMFHWIKVDASQHPLIAPASKPLTESTDTIKSDAEVQKRADEILLEIEERIFAAGHRESVLVARGSWFKAERPSSSSIPPPAQSTTSSTDKEESKWLYFRMTFAAASEDQIAQAVQRFGDALRIEYRLKR